MTLRERLADFISGGALTRETQRADECRDKFHRAVDVLEGVQVERNDLRRDLMANRALIGLASRRADAIRTIAAMETPRCAHIGRRMARVAREAME